MFIQEINIVQLMPLVVLMIHQGPSFLTFNEPLANVYARSSQSAGRDDWSWCITGRYSFLARLKYCCCCCCVTWNCTVQRRYCACTNQKAFLILPCSNVCMCARIRRWLFFVIFNVLRVQNVQKAPESYLSAEHTRTQHKFRRNIGAVVMSLLLALFPLSVCLPPQLQ